MRPQNMFFLDENVNYHYLAYSSTVQNKTKHRFIHTFHISSHRLLCSRINHKSDGLFNGDIHHRYLDSDCIIFKTFVFLAVYWSIWTSSYNRHKSWTVLYDQASTMLKNVFNYCVCHIFCVQIFSRFWTRWGNLWCLNFAIFVMFP